MKIQNLLTLREQLGGRLKHARQALGWTQAQLAKLGGVSKVTQSSYETGLTEPTTAYLRSIQQSGIDLNEVLYGVSSIEIDTQLSERPPIDWEKLQRCYEDVDFFCQRFAPECPSTYRWKLVARLYNIPQRVASDISHGIDTNQSQTIRTLSNIWSELGNP